MLQRLLIKNSFKAWCQHCGFEPARHHELLIEKLEAVTDGKINRLAVFLPPGSAKSTYCSDLFPPWYLNRNPTSRFIAGSHTTTLAESFGKRVRNRITDNHVVLGYNLRSDSRAAAEWKTQKGGEYLAAGIGTGIAGRRATVALIDDPVKSKEDAESETQREKAWDWFLFDLRPRLFPTAAIVLIQTRWHEDDLAGRILATEGEKWEIINLPMVAEESNDPLGRKIGERLWPEWFTDEQVEEAMSVPRLWTSLYQQRPTPEAGDYFKREWIKAYTTPAALPPSLSYIAGSDHALREKEENDATCIINAGIDVHNNLWILPDIFWDRKPTDEVVSQMLKFMQRYSPDMWCAGKDHITGSIGPFLRKLMRDKGIFTYINELTDSLDKAKKNRAAQGRMQMGSIYFPVFADWWPKAKHELLTFDKGKHDDFVDALGNICRGLKNFNGPSPEEIEERLSKRPKRLTFDFMLQQEQERKDRELIALDDA